MLLGFAGFKVYSVYYPQFISKLKTEIQKKFDITLDFSSLQINSIHPLGLKVYNLSAKKNNQFDIQIKTIEIKILNALDLIQKKTKKLDIAMSLNDWNVEFTLDEKNKNSGTSIATNAPLEQSFNSLEKALPVNPYIDNIKFALTLLNGKLVTQKNHEKAAEFNSKILEVSIRDLKEPVKIKFDGEIKSLVDNFNLSYPLSISTYIKYHNGWIDTQNADFKFIGIENNLNFKFHPSTKFIDLSSEIDVPNLNKLPLTLIEKFPLNNLMGSLKCNFKINGYLERNPFISSNIDLKIQSADLSLKQNDVAGSGNFNLSLKTNFEFQQKLNIHNIKWSADFTKTHLEKNNFFKKPIGIPFTTEGAGSFNDDFNLETFNLHFDQIQAQAQGRLSLDKSSQFSFNVPEFNFKGFERYLLFIPQYPVSGKFSAKGSVQGILKDPKNLNLNLDLIKLIDFKYTLYKKINDVEIEGPIKADFQGSIHVDKQIALKGDLNGHINADNLEIKKNGDSLKINEDPLKVDFKTKVVNQKIQIEKFDIKSMFAWLEISGKPPVGFNDPMNLNFKVTKINWNRIRNFLPKNEIINNIKNISAAGSLNIIGSIHEKDLFSSPILITGSSQVAISEIFIPWDFTLKTSTDEKTKEEENKLILPEAFITQKELLSKIKFSNILTVDKMILKDQKSFENIQFTSRIENNNLQFEGDIKKIFTGELKIKSLSIPLTTKDPSIHYSILSQNIDLSALLSLFLPAYKNLIKGPASLQVEGNTHLPYSVNFKKNLEAKGDFNYADGKLNTLDLAKLVKEKLMLLPGIGLPKKIENSQIEGQIKSHFDLKNLMITLTDFSAKSKKGEELMLNGSVDMALTANLKAQLFLIDLPLKGDFINANKDPQGRISFPMEIKGKLTEPQWNFVSNSLENMTNKYLNNEKQKVINLASKEVEKKKNETQRAVQSEINKQKNKLENEAKKALDGLFK